MKDVYVISRRKYKYHPIVWTEKWFDQLIDNEEDIYTTTVEYYIIGENWTYNLQDAELFSTYGEASEVIKNNNLSWVQIEKYFV